MKPSSPPPGTAPVSVIVPTYNRARFLKDSLPSLLGQTRPPAEVLVVDDGSTDDTAAVVGGFGSSVRYLRKENGGKAAALNLALPRTRQPLVWIFDDDDVAEPHALETLAEALDRFPEAGFSWGGYRHIHTDRRGRFVPHPPFPQPAFGEGDLYPALLVRCFILQPGLLVRRAAYDAVGPFDERLFRSQDYEMLLRLARRFPGVDTGRVVFAQRLHTGPRGPAGQEFAARDVMAKWRHFDAITFRTIHASHSLREYLPRGASALGEPGEALARRMAIMGRKGLWDLAAADLSGYAAALANADRSRPNPTETAAFRCALDDWSYGREPLAGAEGEPFRRALAELADPVLAASIRRSLIWPLPYILRRGLTDGAFGDARVTWRLLRLLARPGDLAGLVAGKALRRLTPTRSTLTPSGKAG